MVCIRISDIKGAGSTECIQGFVHCLGEDGASISAAIEARYGDPVFSRLFGRPVRIDRISALADPTTFEVSFSTSCNFWLTLCICVRKDVANF